jgi:hypothetical protein
MKKANAGARKLLNFVLLVSTVFSSNLEASSFDHAHSLWTEILQRNVQLQNGGRTSTFNYSAIKNDPQKLNDYLRTLSAVKQSDFDSFSMENQIAFLINIYNSFMVSLVVENHPIKSVKELGIPRNVSMI